MQKYNSHFHIFQKRRREKCHDIQALDSYLLQQYMCNCYLPSMTTHGIPWRKAEESEVQYRISITSPSISALVDNVYDYIVQNVSWHSSSACPMTA